MTVEDGTGLAAANAYVAEATADTYHLARGNTAWAAALTGAKQAAIVRASQALDGMYGKSWPGVRLTSAQGLDWPRGGAYDLDGYVLSGVPQGVADAACEAALLELTAGTLAVSIDQSVEEVQVGPIRKKMRSGGQTAKTYPTVARALRRIIRGGGGNVAIDRA